MTSDRESIIDVYQRLLDAWNRRDADAFAALFTGDGSTIGFDGSQMNGRDEIRSALRAIFADHQTATYVAIVREVRSLPNTTFLIRAVAGMTPRGGGELNPAVNAVQSAVLVDEEGQPHIALLQNTPAAFHGRPELADALTQELTGVLQSGAVVQRESR
jgi:uncharacterized protein (TIGR02246 family)